MQEQELFQQYELKGWQISPRLYKIIGASVLANLVAFALMAQANFLTGKTCDSPFASGVCSVMDALYMGSVLATTDTGYVDKDYTKIDLDSEEIVMVDLTGEYPPLTYPAGYFALANPEQQQPTVTEIFNDPNMPATTSIPGITNVNPTITTPDLSTTQPNLPKPNKKAVIGNLPKDLFGEVNNPTTVKNKNNPRNVLTQTPNKVDDVAENKDSTTKDETIQSDAIPEIEINKKPLQDFADLLLPQWAAKQVDLNQPFTVVMNGALTKEGTLDPTKSKFDESQTKGDPKMVEIAKEAIESVGASNWLAYLQKFGVEKIKITLAQDNDNITAIIESEQKTPDKAKTLASQVNMAITIAKATLKGDDEKTLLSGAKKSTFNGKVFLLNFEIPKPKAQEMINRKLTEAQAKKQQTQPNSTSQNFNSNKATAE